MNQSSKKDTKMFFYFFAKKDTAKWTRFLPPENMAVNSKITEQLLF
jgi:hypothetical protein